MDLFSLARQAVRLYLRPGASADQDDGESPADVITTMVDSLLASTGLSKEQFAELAMSKVSKPSPPLTRLPWGDVLFLPGIFTLQVGRLEKEDGVEGCWGFIAQDYDGNVLTRSPHPGEEAPLEEDAYAMMLTEAGTRMATQRLLGFINVARKTPHVAPEQLEWKHLLDLPGPIRH